MAVEKALAKHDRRTSIEGELSLIAAKREHLVDSVPYGELLSDARRPLADFFNSLLGRFFVHSVNECRQIFVFPED